jgi:hypothetical protein
MDMYFTTTSGNVMVLLGWVLYIVAIARGIRPETGKTRGRPDDDGTFAQQPQ